ncbi:hypothetical protein C0992_010955, partial [Termitomyces sp. T32_za158]
MAENEMPAVGDSHEYKASCPKVEETALPQAPLIHDPGNGPRVQDIRTFLSSKFFAQPPALN